MISTDNRQERAQHYVDHLCYRMLLTPSKACRISHSGFTDAHARQLADCVAKNESLRKLDIIKCPNLGANGMKTVCHALKNSELSHLSLEDAPLGDEGLEAITCLLSSDETACKLKWLGLEDIGPIQPSTWSRFLSVASTKLQSLDLSRNCLKSCDLVELMQGIRNQNHLSALILSENRIGDDGMERLCQALDHNRSIILLAVGDCGITARGIRALANSLRRNCSLQRLYIYGNDIDRRSSENLEIRYWLKLNASGRAFLRSEEFRSGYFPRVLAKAADLPEILYGLLRELPHVWSA